MKLVFALTIEGTGERANGRTTNIDQPTPCWQPVRGNRNAQLSSRQRSGEVLVTGKTIRQARP